MANITILQQDVELILEKVNTGRYGDVADVVHAALTALDEQERFLRLKAEVKIAREQHERGEGIPYTDEWFEQIKAEAHQDFLDGKQVSDVVTA